MNSARLTRLRIAVGTGVVLALVAVTTAGALDSFTDVADGRFFHGPVKWAADNGITTGTGPTTFEPDRGVTRGESVTFLKRYDDNIVQPAFADRLGRMEIKEIDLALTKGETMNVGSLDGVTVKVTCADAGGGKTDIRIFATSDADGWYMPWHSPSVLSKTDVGEFIALGVYATTIEVASARIDGFSIRTPNGGYTAIDGETLMWVLNPSADPYDCLVVGMYQYFDPA